ncbi:MAG: sel1 repeat family protein [Pseudomonadota bacterium]|nr:sel1 repeat family protein [Pseudomonadota bacterium]
MKLAKNEALEPVLNALSAAKILHLAEDDYSVTFYQAVELFENDEQNKALPLFVIAAEHYCLHAVPYLSHIIRKNPGALQNDISMQARITAIEEWSKHLQDTEIHHKEFYITSCDILNLHKMSQKAASQSNKKSKGKNKTTPYEKQLKAFKAQNSSAGHLFYHQALYHLKSNNRSALYSSLRHAASMGHLLAIAELVRLEQPNTSTNEFFQKITLGSYHQANQAFNFAERIFDTAVSIPNPIGKQSFHFEAVRLGIDEALALVAALYFIEDKKFNQAIGLLAIAIRQNNATARIYFVNMIAKNPTLKFLGYDISPNTLVNMLLDNINKRYHLKPYNFHQKQDFNITIHIRTWEMLNYYVSHNVENPQICTNNEIITVYEERFAKSNNPEVKTKIARMLCDLLTHHIISRNDSEIEYRIGIKVLPYLKYVFDNEANATSLIDLFYVGVEHNRRQMQLFPNDTAKQLETERELIDYVVKLEAFLSSEMQNVTSFAQKYKKMIEYSTELHLSMIKLDPDNKSIYAAQLNKYLRFAELTRNLQHIVLLADCLTSGKVGFAQNLQKARAILLSLDESVKSQLHILRMIEVTYYLDDYNDYQAYFELQLKYADLHPIFYFEIAEKYCDGFVKIKPNRALAEKYYRLAIDRGHAEAHVGFGIMLAEEYDKYPERIELRADILEHYQCAFRGNSFDAAYFIGRSYLFGDIVEHDLEQARYYFNIAVQRGNHSYSKAYLKMMDYGFKGETHCSFELQCIKLYYLKKWGFVDESTLASFEYGLTYLMLDPAVGIKYLHKSAKSNLMSAQYLLAIFQTLIDFKMQNFSSETIELINSVDYRAVYTLDIPEYINSPVHEFFKFSIIVRQYVEQNYTINADYISEVFDRIVCIGKLDPAIIIAEIRERFPTEEIFKTRLLAHRMFTQQKSGDQECARVTYELVKQKKSKAKALSNKFSKHEKTDTLSMSHLGTCLKAFLSSGVTAEKRDLKSIKAAMKMHRPHGRGDYNDHQDLEGGRKKTAQEALDVMDKLISYTH